MRPRTQWGRARTAEPAGPTETWEPSRVLDVSLGTTAWYELDTTELDAIDVDGPPDLEASGGAEGAPATGARASLRAHLSVPMFRTAYALIGSTVLTTGLGLAASVAAARLYSLEEVGRGQSAVNALVILSGLGNLRLMNVLTRFLPRARERSAWLVGRSYLLATVACLVACAVYLSLPIDVLPVDELLGGVPYAGVWFTIGVLAFAIFTLQDAVLTGVRGAGWVPLENGIHSLIKLVLVVVLAGSMPETGIFASWVVPTLLALVPINLLIARRLVPANARRSVEAEDLSPRRLAPFAAAEYAGALCELAVTNLVPLIVAAHLGLSAAGAFGVAWLIGTTLDHVVIHFGASLTVEGAADPGQLATLTRQLLRRSLLIVGPIAAVVVLGAPLVLKLFGGTYANRATSLLSLLGLALVPRLVCTVAVVVARVRNQVGAVMWIQALLAAGTLAGTVPLLDRMGIAGPGVAYLASSVVVAVLVLPRLIASLYEGRHFRSDEDLVEDDWDDAGYPDDQLTDDWRDDELVGATSSWPPAHNGGHPTWPDGNLVGDAPSPAPTPHGRGRPGWPDDELVGGATSSWQPADDRGGRDRPQDPPGWDGERWPEPPPLFSRPSEPEPPLSPLPPDSEPAWLDGVSASVQAWRRQHPATGSGTHRTAGPGHRPGAPDHRRVGGQGGWTGDDVAEAPPSWHRDDDRLADDWSDDSRDWSERAAASPAPAAPVPPAPPAAPGRPGSPHPPRRSGGSGGSGHNVVVPGRTFYVPGTVDRTRPTTTTEPPDRHGHGHAGSRGREGRRVRVAWSLLPLALGLGLLALSVLQVDRDDPGGAFGLVTVLPAPWWLGVAAVTASFAWLVVVAPQRHRWLLAHLVLLVLALHATPGLIEAHARFPTAWTHIGFVDHVVATDSVDPGYDARYNWPGFFSLGSFLVDLTGAESGRSLARFAPVMLNLLMLAPLTLLARHVSRDNRVRWVGLWLVVITNWVGQDYLAPQPLALLAYLVVVGVLLRWFRRANPRPASGLDLLGRLRRRYRSLIRDDRLSHTVSPPPAAGAIQELGLVVIIALVGAVLSFSHQLTPFMLVIAAGVLVVTGRVDRPLVALILAVCAVAWVGLGTTEYLRSNLESITSALGNVGGVVQDNQERVGPGQARQLILATRLALTALAGLLAVVGFWRQWRARRADWALVGLIVAPAMLAVLNSYGGEVLLRVQLFSLPFLALLGAFALVKEGASVHGARYVGAIVFVATAVMVPLFVAARYGNESFERIYDSDIAAWDHLVETAPEDATVVVPDFAGPWRYSELMRFEYRVFADESSGSPNAANLDSFLTPVEGPAYVVLGTGTARYRAVAEGYVPGWTHQVTDQLVATGRYEVVFQSGETRVLRRTLVPAVTLGVGQ